MNEGLLKYYQNISHKSKSSLSRGNHYRQLFQQPQVTDTAERIASEIVSKRINAPRATLRHNLYQSIRSEFDVCDI